MLPTINYIDDTDTSRSTNCNNRIPLSTERDTGVSEEICTYQRSLSPSYVSQRVLIFADRNGLVEDYLHTNVSSFGCEGIKIIEIDLVSMN